MHSVFRVPGTRFVCEVPDGAHVLPIGGSDVLIAGFNLKPYLMRMNAAGEYVREEIDLTAAATPNA